MNNIKVTTIFTLSIGLLLGCNTDLRDKVIEVNKSPLIGGYWEIIQEGETNTPTASNDLPNIYVFDGTNQKYYSDDNEPGIYTIYPTSFIEDIDEGKITFKYYLNSLDETELTGSYLVSSEGLTISDTNLGTLLGKDYSTNDLIVSAITIANNQAGSNNMLHILDTNHNGAKEDTGELRIKLADSTSVAAITSGKLTVDLIYQEDSDSKEDADGTSDNAYISLYASDTSNSFLHGEVAFEKGKIKFRDASKTLTDTGGTFELGETLNVEVSWLPDSFSFTVNGIEYINGGAVTDGSAVTTIAVRLGANSDTTNFEILGDNLMVFSSDTGSEERIFEENFDGHVTGFDLATFYDKNSSEATVVNYSNTEGPTDSVDPCDTESNIVITDNFESYTVGQLISSENSTWTTQNIFDDVSDASGTTSAEVSDVQASGCGNQSLYLTDHHTSAKPYAMREFSSPATSGSVSIDAYFPSTNNKSTYINIGEGKNNSQRYFELNQSGNKLKYEAGSDDVTIADIVTDQWYAITISWTENGLVTVLLDDKVVADNIEQSSTGLDPTIIPSQITLITGDNSGNANEAYFDNLHSDLF
ncbi:hypothetical protein [Vibrio sp. MA40-2]|uniref:hypothetical protein n=1 Tax=Vibrio sp. MA40-2 TaxID=3391828 RepID=UPI0039A7838A